MKLLPSLLGLFTILFLAHLCISACSCSANAPANSKENLNWSLQESQAIFSGEVLAVDTSPQNPNATVKIRIKEFWKGAFFELATITTPLKTASCGSQFKIGQSYLVFARRLDHQTFTTNSCFHNRRIEKASAELKILGQSKKPFIEGIGSKDPRCPFIDIINLDENSSLNKSVWRYIVRLDNLNPKIKPIYHWTVEYGGKPGEIKSGQGTSLITINKGSLLDGVGVGLKIEGLEKGCADTLIITSIS